MRTVRAYHIKLALQEFWKFDDRETAEAYFKKWYYWATHCKLPAIVKAAKTLKNHWEGIISYFDNRYFNGLLEGLNSMIQSLKANARGYRNDENFMTMIYLRQGQLKLNLPT